MTDRASAVPTQVLTFKYRLLPSKAQHVVLARILEDQRILYNAALQERIDCYRKTGKGRSYISQAMSLAEIRRDAPESYGAVPANISRSTLQRIHRAFDGFFRRVKLGGKAGFPRFKSRDRWHSFGFAEFSGIRFDGKRIRFKGLPSGLRVHIHRPLPEGKVLGAIFRRDADGWSVLLQARMGCAAKRIISSSVGVDAGILSLAHLSDGVVIPNPRVARKAERGLRRRQRTLARCKRGSRRRQKAKATLATAHRNITNGRRTALHQASAMLVKRYDLIAVEALNIKGLAAGILARDVNDSAWATFFQMLRYKAERAGATLIEVDPKFTSQACSGCGVIVKKALSQRVHSCPDCGLVLDRDHNAAINILHRAVLRPGEHNVTQWGERARGNLKAAVSR